MAECFLYFLNSIGVSTTNKTTTDSFGSLFFLASEIFFCCVQFYMECGMAVWLIYWYWLVFTLSLRRNWHIVHKSIEGTTNALLLHGTTFRWSLDLHVNRISLRFNNNLWFGKVSEHFIFYIQLNFWQEIHSSRVTYFAYTFSQNSCLNLAHKFT